MIIDEYTRLFQIWSEVADGRGNHGSFLRAFATAYLAADLQNAAVLHDAATELVRKYHLESYVTAGLLTDDSRGGGI